MNTQKKIYYTDLTDREKAILLGSALGDGTFVKRKNSYRIRICHSVKQGDYTRWMHKELSRLCSDESTISIRTDNKGYQTEEFYLEAQPYMETLYHMFYKKTTNSNQEPSCESEDEKYRKTITPELVETLPDDGVLLAVWFMDDGSVRNDAFSGKLATEGFTKEENELLCLYLARIGINASVVANSVEKQQYYISLVTKAFKPFIVKAAPTIREVPSMEYKLNLNRISKSRWPDLKL